MTTSSVFRDSLRKRSASRGIANADGLSAALGFKGDDRRWLKRAWKKGISRPDPRRAKALKVLAQFFKIQAQEFWVPYEEPSAVAERFWRRSDFEDGVSVVREVTAAYQILQRTRQQNPAIYREAMTRYSQMEEALIYYWVDGAARYLDEDDANLLCSVFGSSHEPMFAEADEAFRTLRHGDLFDFLQEHFSSNPNWRVFIGTLEELLKARHNASDASDGALEWLVVSAVDAMITGIKNEPQSKREILEKFEARFINGPSEAVLGLAAILTELRLHPHWKRWVENEHSGCEESACQQLQQQWKMATDRGEGKVTIDSFVEFYSKELANYQ